MKRSMHLPHSQRRIQAGFTLMELLVAIAIGLFVITILVQGFAATSSTSSTNSNVSEARTNGRYALEMIKRDVRHASLHRLVWSTDQITSADPTVDTTDFGCGAGFVTALATGLSAANDSNAYSASCLANGSDRNYLRGDVLVVRHTELSPTTSYDSGAPYVRTSYGAASLFLGGSPTVAPLLPDPKYDYRLVTNVYFINSFTTSSTESPLVPALYRLTLSKGSNPTLQPELVASNVDHMQVQFAMTDATGKVRYYNAGSVTDWTAVTAVRIWLVARESSPQTNFASGTYTIGDLTWSPADNYRRTVYSTTIAVREQPVMQTQPMERKP